MPHTPCLRASRDHKAGINVIVWFKVRDKQVKSSGEAQKLHVLLCKYASIDTSYMTGWFQQIDGFRAFSIHKEIKYELSLMSHCIRKSRSHVHPNVKNKAAEA